MIKRKEYNDACTKALSMIDSAGIVLSPSDREKISAADFGLGRLWKEGIQILTLFETKRIAAKILVLFPYQTIPEHWHPRVVSDPGKEEVIRAVWGDLCFYIPGKDTLGRGFIVKGSEACYTVKNEVIMAPGDQLVISPGTRHWFQAGEKGAVLYSFSSRVRDVLDQFTDPSVVRETVIGD